VFLALNAGPRLVHERAGHHVDRPWRRGNIQIARAGEPRYWRLEGPLESIRIVLEPRLLERVALEACAMDPARVELLNVFGTRDRVITQVALALWAELTTAGLGGPLYVASLTQVLAIHLLRTSCAQVPSVRHATGGLPPHTLRLVLAYITEHLAQPIILRDLAAVAHMDQYHFLRAFRQTTGVTPHQDLLARRIARAQALLEDPTVSITEVAARVGFQTASHFAMLFRRWTGVTPTVYRTVHGRRPPVRVVVPANVRAAVPLPARRERRQHAHAQNRAISQ
jgi:AraC family transcriptional regulator